MRLKTRMTIGIGVMLTDLPMDYKKESPQNLAGKGHHDQGRFMTAISIWEMECWDSARASEKDQSEADQYVGPGNTPTLGLRAYFFFSVSAMFGRLLLGHVDGVGLHQKFLEYFLGRSLY